MNIQEIKIMQQELKILKQGGWIYIAEKNTGKDQECCMEGNMGHCWLACNGMGCPLSCKEEHYRTIYNDSIGSPIDRIQEITPNKSIMSVSFKELYDIVDNTTVADACSYDERESLMYMLEECMKEPQRNIIDGRLVYGKTFAIRLYSFLKDLKGGGNRLNIAIDFAWCLFAYQVATVKSEEEQKYLKNLSFPYTVVSY